MTLALAARPDERLTPLERLEVLADPGSLNLGRSDGDGVPAGRFVYRNSFDVLAHALDVCREQRLGPSMAIFEPGFLRTVIAYGLIAFVIHRLSPSRRARNLAVIAAIAVIVLMAFDRLYLDVHWESDVIGGLILGSIGLLAGTVWLDRPRNAQN